MNGGPELYKQLKAARHELGDGFPAHFLCGFIVKINNFLSREQLALYVSGKKQWCGCVGSFERYI